MSEASAATYIERAGKMATKARKLACREAGEHWREATKAAADVGALQIECLNQMRGAGEKILEASGRTQLSFGLEVKEFIRRELLPHLPHGMELPQVQACVHIASHIAQPIKTLDELKAAKHEMQLAFETLGLIESRRRSELQCAHARHLFADFTSRASGLVVLFKDLQKEEPMESWPADKLDIFLENCQPIKEAIQKAEKIKLGLNTVA